jgi:hypothetical protein
MNGHNRNHLGNSLLYWPRGPAAGHLLCLHPVKRDQPEGGAVVALALLGVALALAWVIGGKVMG